MQNMVPGLFNGIFVQALHDADKATSKAGRGFDGWEWYTRTKGPWKLGGVCALGFFFGEFVGTL